MNISSDKAKDQSQVWWVFEQSGLEDGISNHGRSVGTRSSWKSLVTQIILCVNKIKQEFILAVSESLMLQKAKLVIVYQGAS